VPHGPGHGLYRPNVNVRATTVPVAVWHSRSPIGRTSCSRSPEYAVELREPGLGLNLAPGAAERFANALLARLGRP
jgi:hypothetical protein